MARARKKDLADKPKTLKRKIFFYRLNAGTDTSSLRPRAVEFQQPLERLTSLSFDEAGRYLKTSDGDKQLCLWSEAGGDCTELRLAHIRRDTRPPVEHGGELSPLRLKEGEGLAELTHLILFPGNICAAEFNFYGPRASQLAYYCAAKLNMNEPAFKLNPLIRGDLEDRLSKVNDIKLLTMKVQASYAATVRAADRDLGAALDAISRASDARDCDEVQISFVRKKKKTSPIAMVSEKFIQAIKSLAMNPETKENISIFKAIAVGEDGSSLFDFLSEQFSFTKDVNVATDGSRGVDSESMFQAIREAYEEVKPFLESASDLEQQEK